MGQEVFARKNGGKRKWTGDGYRGGPGGPGPGPRARGPSQVPIAKAPGRKVSIRAHHGGKGRLTGDGYGVGKGSKW